VHVFCAAFEQAAWPRDGNRASLFVVVAWHLDRQLGFRCERGEGHPPVQAPEANNWAGVSECRKAMCCSALSVHRRGHALLSLVHVASTVCLVFMSISNSALGVHADALNLMGKASF